MPASRVAALDRAVLRAALRIRVLSSIAWSPRREDLFLDAWRGGRRELPEAGTEPVDRS